MLYRVETGLHPNLTDTQGRKTALHILKALHVELAGIRQVKVYTVDGLDEAQVRRLVAEGIWHDPILQEASLEPLPPAEPQPHWYVEVGFRPGVTDNEARTARDTAAMVLGLERESLRVYTAVQYRIACLPDKPLDRDAVEQLTRSLLCNDLIQRFRVKSREEWQAEPGFAAQAAQVTGRPNDTVETIPLSGMDDAALRQASRDNTWALTLDEMHCIRDQFARPEESERRKQNEPEQRGFFEIIAKRAEKGRAVPMPRFADHVPHRRAERRGRSAERENRQRAHDPQNVQPRELRRLREKAQDGGIRIKEFFHIATSGRISLLYRNK